MTYYPSTPQPTEKRNATQSLFLSNFQALEAASAVDHVPFATATDTMYHKKVSLIEPLGPFPSTNPAPNFPDLAAPLASLFTMAFSFLRNDKDRVANELFFQNAANAASVFQLTNRSVNIRTGINEEIVTVSIKTPWGLTLNCGIANVISTAVTTYNLPTGFTYSAGDHYTTVLTIGAKVENATVDSFKVSNLTDTSFDYQYVGTLTNQPIISANFISIGKTA